MTEFKKGEVVQLKSGGPKMTIQDLADYGPMGPKDGALCVWFEKAIRHEHVFDVAVLTKPSTPMPFSV